jgi:hypothetical protein
MKPLFFVAGCLMLAFVAFAPSNVPGLNQWKRAGRPTFARQTGAIDAALTTA